ncbi:MAG: hypothetical protein GY930_15795 [bacterium]|nr:hypothetical protein [bacterium]
MKNNLLFSAVMSILLTITAAAKNGTDDRANPTPIGEGSFAFDTSTMTSHNDLDGCNSNLCAAPSFFRNDMFWVYTATVDGYVQFDTIGSTFDTQLAIFSGTDCSAVCLDNDDDTFGSPIPLPATHRKLPLWNSYPPADKC